MTLANTGEQHGIGQYRFPRSYFLTGKSYGLTAADGARIRLEFLDRERVRIDGELSFFDCVPAAEDVYFVSLLVAARFIVLDLKRGHAVVVDDTLAFFAIDGLRDAGDIAAGLTDEMTGTSVRWHLGAERYLDQQYVSDKESRLAWSPRPDKARSCRTAFAALGDGLFLIEADNHAVPGLDVPQGLARLVMVQDFHRVLVTGCAYSSVFNDRILFSGYGEFAGR
ncbi:MoaF N-terminal domain-containing protein [Actinoplanes sp. NPDC051851]|uniref:MoaF N-terminal domain-containing protein n=1 Tax=Actinoplanes sp. NPDC051851 TaxID=3154753 RepID=UPI00341D89E0